MTARSVASVRHRLERAALPGGDPGAEDRLIASLPRAPAFMPGMRQYIAERTTFFDESLLSALRRGAAQVVIVGAGYDGRALRYRQPDVTYFEVDHPATQADKRERLTKIGADPSGIVFVPVDFGRQSVAEKLAAAGHTDDRPTHFLCEGVVPYVPRPDLQELFRGLAGRAAAGSTFALDMATPGHDGPLVSRVLLQAVRAGVAMMGERMVTLLDADEARRLLLDAGWSDVVVELPTGPWPVAFALATSG